MEWGEELRGRRYHDQNKKSLNIKHQRSQCVVFLLSKIVHSW